jgi:transposase
VQQIETTRVALRRFIDRLGSPQGLAVCYEAGPGGFDLLRLLGELGVACDVVAPSLIPVRAGDRIKTDRRDAKNLVRLYRGGQLSYVAPPTPETEGLRDLMRCREDLRRARTSARHRVSKQLLRHGRIYRGGRSQWTRMHRAWIARQRLDDELAQAALGQMLVHLDGLDRQLDALDRDLEQIARSERWQAAVEILTRFRGISTRTALGLISDAQATLGPGDYLVLYTDGVTEARRGGILFGETRLAAAVRGLFDRSPQELAEDVRAAAAEFAGSLEDDLEVLVVRLR